MRSSLCFLKGRVVKLCFLQKKKLQQSKAKQNINGKRCLTVMSKKAKPYTAVKKLVGR